MSEPMWDAKAFVRAEKYSEALQNEIDSTHFALWRMELEETPIDDDDDPDDGPPAGWEPTVLN